MKLSNREIQNLVLLELMSPDPHSEEPPILTEAEQSAIYSRFKEDKYSKNWNYLLEPIIDLTTRSRFITLMQELDKDARD